MRELLFRSWVDDHYEHNVPVNKNGKYSHCVSTGFERQYDPSYKEYDVEQSTELEYNFHKYFEHDVCEMDIPVSLDSKKKETVRGFIEFMYGSFFFIEIGGKGRRWIFSDIATMAINSNAKVIYLGDSNNNPELLEV